MTAAARMALTSACLGLTLGLAACSADSGFTTGTLLGGKKEPAPPAAETALDRAKHIGSMSAKAQKCGYVFDPAAMRQNFIASETRQGAAGPVLANVEKAYDLAYTATAKTIGPDEDYCSDDRTSVIKRDLNQALSENYSDPTKKPMANVGWWTPPKAGEKLNREEIFNNPNRR